MLLCDFSCIVLLFTLQHESSVSAVAAPPRPIVLLNLFGLRLSDVGRYNIVHFA